MCCTINFASHENEKCVVQYYTINCLKCVFRSLTIMALKLMCIISTKIWSFNGMILIHMIIYPTTLCINHSLSPSLFVQFRFRYKGIIMILCMNLFNKFLFIVYSVDISFEQTTFFLINFDKC